MDNNEAIREILLGVGVTVKEAIANLDANRKYMSLMGAAVPLIQGYTAEQWQEIIAGGYLCEFGSPDDPILGTIKSFVKMTKGPDWFDDGRDSFQYCRPAQIKGVMRPIFVEPVDKKSLVVYFDGSGQVLSGSRSWLESEIPRTLATKYIEV